EEVHKFLPPFEPSFRLDVDKPWTLGPVGIPDIYAETRMAHNQALIESRKIIDRAWDELADVVGRRYRAVETFRADDADLVFFTMGGVTETCMTAVEELRKQGKKVGIVHLRLHRPFPYDDIRKALLGRKAVVCVDRALSTGFGGPMASEIKAALYGQKGAPPLVEFIAGLGGRDVKVSDFCDMYDAGAKVASGAPVPPYKLVGVRE
ncbi:MAG: transketolase C-terminal domain-containing protein, partial [Polyangia bacterium]|nr:transketolase C-terminal domain-containing protein [Polyangia bacterium]